MERGSFLSSGWLSGRLHRCTLTLVRPLVPAGLHASVTVRPGMANACARYESTIVAFDAVWPALCQEEANGRGSPHSDDMDAFTLHDIEVCCTCVTIPFTALPLPGSYSAGCRLSALRMPRVAVLVNISMCTAG